MIPPRFLFYGDKHKASGLYMQAWKFLQKMRAVSPDLSQKGPFLLSFDDGTQFKVQENFGQSIIEIYAPVTKRVERPKPEEKEKIAERREGIFYVVYIDKADVFTGEVTLKYLWVDVVKETAEIRLTEHAKHEDDDRFDALGATAVKSVKSLDQRFCLSNKGYVLRSCQSLIDRKDFVLENKLPSDRIHNFGSSTNDFIFYEVGTYSIEYKKVHLSMDSKGKPQVETSEVVQIATLTDNPFIAEELTDVDYVPPKVPTITDNQINNMLTFYLRDCAASYWMPAKHLGRYVDVGFGWDKPPPNFDDSQAVDGLVEYPLGEVDLHDAEDGHGYLFCYREEMENMAKLTNELIDPDSATLLTDTIQKHPSSLGQGDWLTPRSVKVKGRVSNVSFSKNFIDAEGMEVEENFSSFKHNFWTSDGFIQKENPKSQNRHEGLTVSNSESITETPDNPGSSSVDTYEIYNPDGGLKRSNGPYLNPALCSINTPGGSLFDPEITPEIDVTYKINSRETEYAYFYAELDRDTVFKISDINFNIQSRAVFLKFETSGKVWSIGPVEWVSEIDSDEHDVYVNNYGKLKHGGAPNTWPGGCGGLNESHYDGTFFWGSGRYWSSASGQTMPFEGILCETIGYYEEWDKYRCVSSNNCKVFSLWMSYNVIDLPTSGTCPDPDDEKVLRASVLCFPTCRIGGSDNKETSLNKLLWKRFIASKTPNNPKWIGNLLHLKESYSVKDTYMDEKWGFEKDTLADDVAVTYMYGNDNEQKWVPGYISDIEEDKARMDQIMEKFNEKWSEVDVHIPREEIDEGNRDILATTYAYCGAAFEGAGGDIGREYSNGSDELIWCENEGSYSPFNQPVMHLKGGFYEEIRYLDNRMDDISLGGKESNTHKSLMVSFLDQHKYRVFIYRYGHKYLGSYGQEVTESFYNEIRKIDKFKDLSEFDISKLILGFGMV